MQWMPPPPYARTAPTSSAIVVPPGVLLGDDRHHVGVGGVAAHRHDDEPVADVVVEVRDDDAPSADLGERQDRHLDDLEGSTAGVEARSAPSGD